MENGNKILSILGHYLMVKYKPQSIRYFGDYIQVTFKDSKEFTDEDFYYFVNGLNINVTYWGDGHVIKFSF